MSFESFESFVSFESFESFGSFEYFESFVSFESFESFRDACKKTIAHFLSFQDRVCGGGEAKSKLSSKTRKMSSYMGL